MGGVLLFWRKLPDESCKRRVLLCDLAGDFGIVDNGVAFFAMAYQFRVITKQVDG